MLEALYVVEFLGDSDGKNCVEIMIGPSHRVADLFGDLSQVAVVNDKISDIAFPYDMVRTILHPLGFGDGVRLTPYSIYSLTNSGNLLVGML